MGAFSDFFGAIGANVFGTAETLTEGDRVERARQWRIRRALRAYEGCLPKPLKPRSGQPDDNVQVNPAEEIVDKGVSFLIGAGVEIQVGTQDDTMGEEFLDRIWPEDQRAADLHDMAVNAAVSGDFLARIAIGANRQPRVIVADPLCFSVVCDPEDYQAVQEYRFTYPTRMDGTTEIRRRERTVRDGGGWVTYFEQQAGGKVWTGYRPEERWPWEFAPYFHAKNLPEPNQYYGKADLSFTIVELIHAIHRLDSMIARVARFHAYPKMIVKGARQSKLDVSADGVIFLPGVEQEIQLLSIQGSIEDMRNYRRDLQQWLEKSSRVPNLDTDKVQSLGQLSGRALKILFGPLIDKTKTKQMLLNGMLKPLVRALLTIGLRQDLGVTISYGDPIPSDPLEERNAAKMDLDMGLVSRKTLSQRFGYNFSNEQDQIALESAAANDARLQQMNTLPDPFMNNP